MSTSVSPKKSPASKKATKARMPPAHPKYQEMVKAAIASLKERNGSSRQAILKYILANYNVGDNLKMVTSRLCLALRRGVASEFLTQKEGHTGPGGRYKLSDAAAKKAPAKPKKKPADKKTPKAEEAEATETENKAPSKPKAKKATSNKPKSSPKKVAVKKSKSSPKKAAAKKPKSSLTKAKSSPAKAKSSPTKKAGAKPKPKKSPKKKKAAPK